VKNTGMGKFLPGKPRLAKSGRKKGTPNKKTVVLLEVLELVGLNVPQKLTELLPSLEPEKQADVLLELLSYLYPKRKALDHLGIDGPIVQLRQSNINVRAILTDPAILASILQLEKVFNDDTSS
jgi:hypothetical protein